MVVVLVRGDMSRSKKLNAKKATPQAEPTWWAELPSTTRIAFKWLAGILAAAAATVVAGLLTGALQNLFDPQEVKPAKPRLPFTTIAKASTDTCDAWWVPKAPSDLKFKQSMNMDSSAWAARDVAKGGAPASPTSVTLTVQGRTEAAVVLTDVDVRIVKKRQVPAGTILQGECGSRGAFRAMDVELDAAPPRVKPYFKESILDLGRKDIRQRSAAQFGSPITSELPRQRLF